MRNKLERLTDEFISKHPKATIEEAFRGGYLAHVDELLIYKKSTTQKLKTSGFLEPTL